MNIIKFHVEDNVHYPIEKTLFENITDRKKPYYDKPEQPEKGSQFAVCPACNNPVQVIGLYQKSQHTTKPYAKHYTHSIKDLAIAIQENYDHCPLSAKRTRHLEYAKRAKANELSIGIIQRLVTQFDKVIYYMESQIQMHISDALAREMLVRYFANRGYLFYDASLINIPLMFFNASLTTWTLFGRIVRNKTLQEALTKHFKPALRFENNKLTSTAQKYIDVEFSFIHHELHHTEDGTHETIVFSVHTRAEDGISSLTLYRQTIPFDPSYYMNLVNYDERKLSVQQRARNTRLLALAKEVATESKFEAHTYEST